MQYVRVFVERGVRSDLVSRVPLRAVLPSAARTLPPGAIVHGLTARVGARFGLRETLKAGPTQRELGFDCVSVYVPPSYASDAASFWIRHRCDGATRELPMDGRSARLVCRHPHVAPEGDGVYESLRVFHVGAWTVEPGFGLPLDYFIGQAPAFTMTDPSPRGRAV